MNDFKIWHLVSNFRKFFNIFYGYMEASEEEWVNFQIYQGEGRSLCN